MSKQDKTLRERLLNMETLNSMPRETLREQVQAMLDKKLRLTSRIGLAFLALVGLWTVTRFGGPAFTPPRAWGEAFFYHLFVIFGFFVSVAWTVFTGWAALSGTIRRTHRPWTVTTTLTMGFVYIVLFMLIFVTPTAQAESRAIFTTQWALIGFFLFNTIGVCAVLGVLYRGQFKSQEKLLEIEYRLADLAEKIEKRQGG